MTGDDELVSEEQCMELERQYSFPSYFDHRCVLDLIRTVRELRAVLKSVEWAGTEHFVSDDDQSLDPCCPACREVKVFQRHAADCRLARAIGGK